MKHVPSVVPQRSMDKWFEWVSKVIEKRFHLLQITIVRYQVWVQG